MKSKKSLKIIGNVAKRLFCFLVFLLCVSFAFAGDPYRIDENMQMETNSIFNATNINSTSFWQNGFAVLDTSSSINTSNINQSILNVNSSTYWDDENSQADLNVNSSTYWDSETSQADLNVNKSVWWGSLINWSRTMFEGLNGVLSINMSWFNNSVDARITNAEPDLNVNSSTYWDDENSQADLNVNSSDYWDGLDSPDNFSWSGDLSGTGLSPSVVDDSHNHGSTTIADEYLFNSGDEGTENYNFTESISISKNLNVNNSVLFVNSSSGKVGIGTLNPNNALEVVGTINASKIMVGIIDVLNTENYTAIISYVDSQDVIYNNSMIQYVILSNGTMKIYVDAQDVIYNDSMVVYVDRVNVTQTAYTDFRDSVDNLHEHYVGNLTNGTFGIGNYRFNGKVKINVSSGGAAEIGRVNNVASGDYSVAFGSSSTASGSASASFGTSNTASGKNSVVFGAESAASGQNSIALGSSATASGLNSVSMGTGTTASGTGSTAIGWNPTASGNKSTSMGSYTTASGQYSTAMGYDTTASGNVSTAIGDRTTASGDYSTSIGSRTTASGLVSTAIGIASTASGDYSTTMGDTTTASGSASTAMGAGTLASGIASTAMGWMTVANGTYSTAMGFQTIANGTYSTSMGAQTRASGTYSTATGISTTASGYTSTAMGSGTIANGTVSTAMGAGTIASGLVSTAIGEEITAQGDYSVAIALNNQNGAVVSQNNVMSIMGGKVGIGTLDPSQELTVVGEVNATDFIIPNISLGQPTYSTINDYVNLYTSAGRLTGGNITANSTTTVNVTDGTGFIRIADDDISQIKFFDWSSKSNFVIPFKSTRYLGVEYNGGSPQVVMHTTEDWDLDTSFPLGTVTNDESTDLHVLRNPWWIGDAVTNIIEKSQGVGGYITRDQSIGGLILSVPGIRNVAVTAGTLWSRLNEHELDAIDTNVSGTVELYWRNSSGYWFDADQTQYNVTHYNDITQDALVTLTNNRYANFWVYAEADDKEYALVYPQAQYVSASGAEAESPPSSLPLHIQENAILIGRIVFQQGMDTPVDVQSAFDTVFTASAASDHGNLAGLGDDDHTQYLLADGSRALTAPWDAVFNATFEYVHAKVNASYIQNAPWLTSSESGNVSSVNGDEIYTYNSGTDTVVIIAFNETKLNGTIDLRDTNSNCSNPGDCATVVQSGYENPGNVTMLGNAKFGGNLTLGSIPGAQYHAYQLNATTWRTGVW